MGKIKKKLCHLKGGQPLALAPREGQDRKEVQEKIFAIWRAYEEHRADSCQPGSFVVEGVDLPVYTRPPGYDSEQVRKLAECASKYDPHKFNMAGNTAHAVPPAVCIVDSDCGEQSKRSPGDRVSFGGPKGRVLYPVENSQTLYLARVGADRIPPGTEVKPWRFDLVAGKEAPAGHWYVCLFVPYAKPVQAQSKRRRVDEHVQGDASSSPGDQPPSVGGEGASGATVEAGISMLVETLFKKAKSEGFLTRGGEQENEFRRMATQSLQTVTEQIQERTIMSGYILQSGDSVCTVAHESHWPKTSKDFVLGFVLIAVCTVIAFGSSEPVVYSWGPPSSGQGILLSIYFAILFVSILLLAMHSRNPNNAAIHHMVAVLLATQIIYKVSTPATAGAANPVAISNLCISGLHAVTLYLALRCVTALVRRFSNAGVQSANLPAVTKRAQKMWDAGSFLWRYRADFDKAIGAGLTKVHVPPDGSIPKDLQCALSDGTLILDAVILPCCGLNVSKQVVQARIQESYSCPKYCPICMTPDVTLDMMQENKKLQATARAFLRCANEKGIAIQGMGAPARSEATNEKSASNRETGKGGEGSGASPHRREISGDGVAEGGGGSKAAGEDVGSGDEKAKVEDVGQEGENGKKRNCKKKRGERGSNGAGKMLDVRGAMAPGVLPLGGPGVMGGMRRTRVAAVLRDAFATPLPAPPPETEVKKSGCTSSTVSQIAASAVEVPEAPLCTVKEGDSEEEGGGGGGTGNRVLNKVGEGSVGKEGKGRLRTGMLVSSMLYKKEAELFCQFAQHLHEQAGFTGFGLTLCDSAWCDRLKKILQHTLQHQEITVSVKGSVEKGTNTSDSDIDVFIDTHGLRVSRQEKKRIVEVLRTADGFHQSHVKLKKLAIGCVVFNTEVDLVFSDTEEYGQLPGNFVQRFKSDKAVQNAARMLKISFQRSSFTSLPPKKVPSFVLETLVLEAQEYRAKMMLSDVLSDGSMELFCDALQFLVDSPEILNSAQAKLFALASEEPCGLQGTKLRQGELHSAQRHALDLLHLLCASRFFSLGQKGFTNLFDIERWIRKYSGAEFKTPLGPVPGWIMGRINNAEEARNPFIVSGETHPGNFQNGRTLKECVDVVDGNHASTVFLGGPMARYTLMGAFTSSGDADDDLRVGARVRLHSLQAAAQHNGAGGELLKYNASTGRWDVKLSNGHELAVRPGNLTVVSTTSGGDGAGTNSAGKSRTQQLSRTTMMKQMQELLEYAQRGSVVAQHMLLTRQQWMTAEMALLSEDYEKAVRFFALSARSSHADGDPFSGWWDFDDAGLSRKYHKAVDFISRSNRSSEDPQLLNAKLVRAWMCFPECKWSLAEELLTDCITQSAEGSVDPAFYLMRLVVRGCVKDWRGNLEDAQRCIELIPEDPIPYFWKGIAMRNLCGNMQAKDAGEKDAWMIDRRNAVRHFIKIAPQEGRKVCQAWWELAVVEMQQLSRQPSLSTETKFTVGDTVAVEGLQAKHQHNGKLDIVFGRLKELIDKGFEAEERMLPILREHEARQNDPKKETMRMQRKAFQSVGDPNLLLSALFVDGMKAARERGNTAFRSGNYEQAVHEYSSMLEMIADTKNLSFPDLHLLLNDRSAAYEKLQEYDSAQEDALEVIKLKPVWAEGYVRLVRAQISCRNAAGALHSLKQAHANLAASDLDKLRGLEEEVQSLPVKEATRCEPASLACWPSVMFKDSVVVVDADGSGDFVSLRQALSSGSLNTPSTIIVLAGSYTLHGWPDVKMKRFQILGEGNVRVAGAGRATLFGASGTDTSMFLENLKILTMGTPASHCVGVDDGASASITRCEMKSSIAACYSAGKGSSLLLLQCKTCGPGAGPLVKDYGFLEAHDCRFAGSNCMGVEVREFGRCLLKHCTMSDNEYQGIGLYNGGLEAELHDCTIEKCGKINKSGAVMVSSGTVRLRRCSIADNRGDGIVVQDEEGSAHLDLISCRVHRNGGMGIVMYGGSGNIVDNRIQENANLPVGVNCNYSNGIIFRKINFARNTLCSRGIVINAPQKVMRELITFDNNNCLSGDSAIFQVVPISEDMFSDLKNPEEMSKKLESYGVSSIHIDICTGLEMFENGDDMGTSFLGKATREAKQRIRMQNQPPENQDFAAVHFNKESLVAAHGRAIQSTDVLLSNNAFVYTLPGPPPTNRAGPPPTNRVTGAAVSELKECNIKDLIPHLGEIALGRVLYGTTCTPPHRVQGMMTILEDRRGEAVMIALYNVSWLQSDRWRECFPKGITIGIKEPFLKRFADATVGIRVDDPSNVVYVTPICVRLGCGIAQTENFDLKVCSRCRQAKYCSPRCQVEILKRLL
jgi:tetratricopeptide (TPR) repeat protein/uncharacterized membrane protein YgcG/predicted nucleotidyltransferase